MPHVSCYLERPYVAYWVMCIDHIYYPTLLYPLNFHIVFAEFPLVMSLLVVVPFWCHFIVFFQLWNLSLGYLFLEFVTIQYNTIQYNSQFAPNTQKTLRTRQDTYGRGCGGSRNIIEFGSLVLHKINSVLTHFRSFSSLTFYVHPFEYEHDINHA